jgi:hypothetical protein
MTKMIVLSDEDAATVRAVLLTNAEMQDNRAIEGEAVIGRLSRDEPDTAADTIDDLQDTNDTLTRDCEDLKRLASKFE